MNLESEITPKYIGFQKSDLSYDEIYAIDVHLAAIAHLNATLGKDSIEFEREEVRLKISAINEKIKIISEPFYKQITV